VIQPLHFSHGYMFVPMAILTVRCLARIAKDWKLQVKRFAAQYGRYSIIEILIPPTRNLIPRHTDDQY